MEYKDYKQIIFILIWSKTYYKLWKSNIKE